MKRTGFTLIELLVVIAVIALLVALTTTASRMAKAQTKAVLCRSNVRQLTFGLVMYADENETFPHGFRPTYTGPGDSLGSAEIDQLGWWWLNDIKNFAVKSDSEEHVFCCPSKKLDSLKRQHNILWGNYGVNRSICRTFPPSRIPKKMEFTGTPLSYGSIPHPGQTLLVVDSGYSLINWWCVTDVPPWPLGSRVEDFSYVPGLGINESRNLLLGQRQDAINGRHPNKIVNVGFADGQVGPRKAQDLFVENIEDTYKNRTPLWVPR